MTRSSSNPLVRWFLGFFAAMFAIALLPRTFVFITRRMAGKIVAEALAILLVGFVSERLGGKPPAARKRVTDHA